MRRAQRKGFAIVAAIALGSCGAQTDYDPVSDDLVEIDSDRPPAIIELNFQSYGDRLNGLLYKANGPGPHPTVVLLHGFPGNEKNLDLAQTIRRAGFNVLFFHYRGAWGSDGTFSFSNVADDVGSALAYLRDPDTVSAYGVDVSKLSLLGHSMGGFASLMGGARDDAVICVGGIAAANLGGRRDVFAADPDAAQGFSDYADNLSMLAGFSGAGAIAEMIENDDAFDVSRLGSKLAPRSVFLVTGRQDAAVPPEIQNTIVAEYENVPNMRLTAKLMDGDHSFSWNRFALAREVIDWLNADCR